MSGTRLPTTIFFVILLAAFAQCVRDFSVLPQRMAVHFGFSGAPNGWMAKPRFFVLYGALALLATAVGFLAPRLIANLSASKINLPNKEYWLAPERRAETLAFFRKQFGWFGCVFLLLEVSVMHLVIQVNSHAIPQLSTGPFLFLISGFVLFTLVWSIAMLIRFSNPR